MEIKEAVAVAEAEAMGRMVVPDGPGLNSGLRNFRFDGDGGYGGEGGQTSKNMTTRNGGGSRTTHTELSNENSDAMAVQVGNDDCPENGTRARIIAGRSKGQGNCLAH